MHATGGHVRDQLRPGVGVRYEDEVDEQGEIVEVSGWCRDLRDTGEAFAVETAVPSAVFDEHLDHRQLSEADRGLHRAHVVAPSLAYDVVLPHAVVRSERSVRVHAEKTQLA